MMLRTIDTDLWVAEQPLKYFGLEVGTRMTVIRLGAGDLLVISPIRPTPELMQQLAEIGEVRIIIAPNLYHHLFAVSFKQQYPDAELWAIAELAEKRPDIPIDRILSDQTIQQLDGIRAVQVEGFNTLDVTGAIPLQEWVFLHIRSRTLILTDLAFHFDQTSSRTVRWIARLLGGYQQLRPSILEKIASRDKAQVRRSIQPILDWDFDRVIVAHGSIVEQGGKGDFQRGYEWFLQMVLQAEG